MTFTPDNIIDWNAPNPAPLEIEMVVAGQYKVLDENGYVIFKILRLDAESARHRWVARTNDGQNYLHKPSLEALLREVNRRWNEGDMT